jgi:hypothetical protein
MVDQTNDEQEIIARIAALDIGKATLTCCVPVPGAGGRRVQEVTDYSTMTGSLQLMVDRLLELGVTRVVMEATSDYWKPPFYLLEAHGLQTWLVNAKDVKHLPGRPKTDRLDAVWLCKVAERQMLRPCFVPPLPVRRLRDLTRYRVALVADRTREKNRVQKLLKDAQSSCRWWSATASGLRPGDDGRPAGRPARPAGAGAAGPVHDAQEDQLAGAGVRWLVHRPPRVPAATDADRHRRAVRRHRRARRPDRAADRLFR